MTMWSSLRRSSTLTSVVLQVIAIVREALGVKAEARTDRVDTCDVVAPQHPELAPGHRGMTQYLLHQERGRHHHRHRDMNDLAVQSERRLDGADDLLVAHL